MGTTSQCMRYIGLQAACGAMILVSAAYATKESDRQRVDWNVQPVVARVDGWSSPVSRPVKQSDSRVTQVLAQAAGAYAVADKGIPESHSASPRLEKALAEHQNRSPVESLRVRFAKRKYDLPQKQKRKLDALAEKLTANPSYTADIDGVAHRQGTKSYNDTLSWKRMEAVQRYLAEKHIDLLPRVSLIGERPDFADAPEIQAGRTDVTITIYKPVVR